MVVLAVVIFVVFLIAVTYYKNTSRERLNNAAKESSWSIERQFERPPNDNELL